MAYDHQGQILAMIKSFAVSIFALVKLNNLKRAYDNK